MDAQPGLRVVRGPDWEWGDQDGGEGHVGTVVEIGEPSVSDGGRAVVVQWDCGERSSYRCGLEGKYDLRVLDSAPTGVQCDVCNRKNLTGMRWKCTRCYDYDLCPICYMAGKHLLEHEFARYDKSHGLKHYIPARTGARKVMAKGAFPRAEVTRGTNWDYGDDDGGEGKTGKAVILKDWNDSSFRSAVDVTWTATDKTMKCRLGHNGKVDIKYVTPSAAGHYYPDHLPTLGAPHQPPGPRDFCSGDYVKVMDDIGAMIDNQDILSQVSDQVGMIHNILDNGEAMVKFGRSSERKLQLRQLTKADIPLFESGESVRIIDDMAEVMKLQTGHGGWNDEMGCTIGRLGVALGQNSSGDVVVSIDKTMYIFNHKCLVRTPDEKVEVNIDDVSFQRNNSELEAEVQALFERNDSLVLCRAAQLGDETVIREFLNKFRNEVDREFDGKRALHHAAFAGHSGVIKTLLEFGADKDILDSNGLSALHFCAFRDEAESAKVLLERGANPNIPDKLGRTPLILAAYRKSKRTVDALVECSKTKLDAQDKEGDTALHCAVYGNWHMAVRPLVFAGANPSLENSRQLSPLHLACAIGFTAAVEVMLKQNPQLINLKNKEGCTPLHLAALNNHSSIVTCLLQYDCNLNIKSLKGHTALHGAIISGGLKTIEKLVGLGANMNAQDNDGDSPLHLIQHSKAEEEVTDQSPQMMKIKQELECFEEVTPHAVLACFLIRGGANIFLKNNAGITALQGLPIQVAAIAASYAQQHQTM